MNKQRTYLLIICLLAHPAIATAHFPWLATDQQGRAIMFFGESPAERDYHLPKAVVDAKVIHHTSAKKSQVCVLKVIEEDEFVGKRSEQPIPAGGELQSQVVYGIYHGTKLNYYVQHDLSLDEDLHQTSEKDHPTLYTEVSRAEQGGVRVRVLWQNKPLSNAKVQLFCEEGHEEASVKTDKSGVVVLSAEWLEPGLNALLIGHVDDTQSGDVEGKEFNSASHYLTATFRYAPAKKAARVPALPEPVASFGATVCDGWLYVYCGHTGTAHDHSRENLSQHFRRVRLEGAGEWQELPIGPPLQGLAMVTHGGKLYRIGGLDARNAPDESDDLHSVASFACFDSTTKTWTELPPLPNGRSSHNAVVVGDTIYVVGGWQLTGDDDGQWQAGAIAFDLSKPDAGWQQLPEPPFRQRALALSHAAGSLVAIGGMSENAEPTSAVFLYDFKLQQWKTGPKFPGKPFHSFGMAAWNHRGVLYAGGMEGVLYRLSDDMTQWEPAGEFSIPRFFHQLLPGLNGSLLAIAGASHDSGHLATTEEIPVP